MHCKMTLSLRTYNLMKDYEIAIEINRILSRAYYMHCIIDYSQSRIRYIFLENDLTYNL